MAELISKAEYARRRGCDPAAVTRAVQKGWISEINGKIDPVVADVQWAANARSRADSRPATEVGARLAGLDGDKRGDDKRGDEAGKGGSTESGYFEARARREAAEAELAELKLQEQLGQLVRVDQVRSETARLAAGLRESLLQLPARLSAVLAAKTEAEQVHLILDAELRKVLEQITEP